MSSLYNRAGTSIGEAVTIDATLSVSGEVADAKATGDGIAEAMNSGNDDSIETWLDRVHYGYISEWGIVDGELNTSNGEVGTTAYGRGTSGFIPVTVGKTYVSRKVFSMCAYDSNKAFVAYVGAYTKEYTCPSGVAYVRITADSSNRATARIVEYDAWGQPNIDGYIYTGATDAMNTAIRKSIADFASDDDFYFAKSNNQFDFAKDFVQYSNGATGINTTTGAFVFNTDSEANEFSTSKSVSLIKYFEVAEGQTLASNRPWASGAYYNSSKVYIGSIGVQTGNHPSWIAPTNCAYVRLNFLPMSSENDVRGLMVVALDYEAENKRTPTYNYPIPMHQIDGQQISPNYLDKVIPNMTDSSFLSAMKCLAIREANGRERAFRLGNFNMYVGNQANGWDLTKKMLMDYGCDFCGFEEVYTTNADLASFLKSWQFPYGFYTNQTDGGAVVDKSFVSRFPVLSSTKRSYTYGDSAAYYLNCKVQLPRLDDVYDPVRTVSMYVCHLNMTTDSYEEDIASQILTVVAQDTSDYIIIFGDFNDAGKTLATKTYWNAFETAGFRPVLSNTSKTVTYDDIESWGSTPEEAWSAGALDQFCVSSNIEIKRYGVVNTKDNYGDTSIQTIEGSGCLSDHDFVWCDLVFKDEARS